MKLRLFIFLSAILFAFNLNATSVKLIKPVHPDHFSYSGDNQTQKTKSLSQPIRVLVTDNNGNPIQGHELVFICITYPKDADNYCVDRKYVCTDSTGIATNHFQLGDKEGVYEILVGSNEDCDAEKIVYTINARKPTWIIFLIIGLLGGLALFLFGMDILSKGMQAAAGSKMRNIISKFTNNRFAALFAGIIVTILVQSSSATSVMLVGFVEAGLIGFAQTLGMLLGAGIGTTVTAQLIALKITDYALLIVAAGFIVTLISKSSKYTNIGKSILGFGLLFFGMYIMSEAMYPLRSHEGFLNILIKLENPFIGILVGFVFTALIQSSAATIGIIITIASQGFLTIEACIPLILGTNIGTGMTAILASLNSGREAKRVAFAHTFFKLIGVLIFAWWIPEYADLVKLVSPNNADVPRQIANTHTIFSIALTILILPFLGFFSKLILLIIPKKPEKANQKFKLKYINSAITSSPAISLGLAKKETERMSHKVQKLLNLSLKPFFDKDISHLDEWQKLESETDFLKENINNYLISVSSQNSDKESFNDAYQIMYVAKELEMIGDIVNTNMRRQVEKWVKTDAQFSEEGKVELETILEKSLKQISRSIEVFNDLNLEKVVHIKKKFKKYSNLAEEYEMLHYERLVSNNEISKSSSQTHLELLGLLKAVNRHATNISRILLNWHKEKPINIKKA
ncbi:MAG: Na/Pi cotransporter family protein [Marinilabiliales bacterium]|nr:MAG: Na/Pi cotransporter family protein [Marinilabiliales bacterium]